MSTTSLTKPGAVQETITSTYLDTNSEYFAMKVFEYVSDVRTVSIETTGDGDVYPPCFDHNGLTYLRLVLRGAMVAGKALGLAKLTANIVSAADGYVDGQAYNPIPGLDLFFEDSPTGRRIVIDNFLIERIQVRASTRGVFHGVTMTGVATDSDVTQYDSDGA